MSYDREAELKGRFNQFISSKITGKNEDYYWRLSVVEVFEEIKSTLKDIHNPKFRKPIISNAVYSGTAKLAVRMWRFPSSFGSSQHYVDTLSPSPMKRLRFLPC